MPLVRCSAKTLTAMAGDGTLVARLAEQFGIRYRHSATPSEIASWERSLPVLAHDLIDAGLGDIEVLVEYRLPQSSKRADVVLCGTHPKTGADSYVVVELKQWTSASEFDGDPELCLVAGLRGGLPVLTPSDQVGRYCEYLRDFVAILGRSDTVLAGAAYLHNATDEKPVGWLRGRAVGNDRAFFTAARRGEFLDFLRARFAPRPGAEAADRFVESKVAPSKQLMRLAATEVRVQEQFVLLDEQAVAANLVRLAVTRAKESDHKQVVIVTGGPGTGKSVIALSLLGEMDRHGYTALHATGSRSFTLTLRKVVGERTSRVKSLFKYFNDFGETAKNSIDVLICDEAHRIRETSANRFTPSHRRTGKAQVEELIDAALVPVFLLDEHQGVRPGEIGTVAAIEAAAAKRGLVVQHISLSGQFRARGSAAYEEWVLRLLDLAPGGPIPWTGEDDPYRLRSVDSPSALETELAEYLDDEGAGARMTAGFCWPWSESHPGTGLVADVQIGDWHRPWNVKGDRAVGAAPPSQFWATDAGGFGQVGCVYTAQGFEYSWNGVVLGPDLVRRDGRWTVVRGASRDPELMKRTTSDEQVDRLVRNVYKVLLTRGLEGTLVYSVDAETQDFLRSLIQSPSETGIDGQ